MIDEMPFLCVTLCSLCLCADISNTEARRTQSFTERRLVWFIGILTILLVILLVWTRSCHQDNTPVTGNTVCDEDTIPKVSITCTEQVQIINQNSILNLIQDKNCLENFHLVNIHDIDSTILVDLKYATTDNFTGMILYDGLHHAYLQPDVALMLAEAHRYLKTLHPDLRLMVYDAVRPLSVQRTMWERVKDTKYHRYVAHPDRLSLHNYGAAVDLTIADSMGQPLDMGTPFDFFGRAAGITDEPALVQQ